MGTLDLQIYFKIGDSSLSDSRLYYLTSIAVGKIPGGVCDLFTTSARCRREVDDTGFILKEYQLNL